MATKKKSTSKGKTIRKVKAMVDHDQDLDADDVIDSLPPAVRCPGSDGSVSLSMILGNHDMHRTHPRV